MAAVGVEETVMSHLILLYQDHQVELLRPRETMVRRVRDGGAPPNNPLLVLLAAMIPKTTTTPISPVVLVQPLSTLASNSPSILLLHLGVHRKKRCNEKMCR
jgi:hypothetical protein